MYSQSSTGTSVSSPQRGSDVSQHEAAADLWGLDAHTDLTEDTPVHSGQLCGVNLGSQRLVDSSTHGAPPTGGNMPPDPALTPCQSEHTLAHPSDPSSEEAQCGPALTGMDSLPCLPNTLAVEISQWLDGTSTIQRTSPHLLSPRSPDITKELLLNPSLDEAMMFDFVPSSPDISPLSLDTCDFGIQMFTGADRTPNHQPSPHPSDLQVDLGGTLDLLDSEEEESDQQDSQDSPITMTTGQCWSSYLDSMSPSGIQDGCTHPSTQSNGCSRKQQDSIHEVQDGGSPFGNGSSCSSHTVNSTDISNGEETQKQDPQRVSLDSDPEERSHNPNSDRGKDIIGYSGPLHHLHYVSPHIESTRSYGGKPETSHLSYEDLHMDHNDCYNPLSDAQYQDYNYYQICPSHSSTIKDQGATLSRLPEEFWVEKPRGTTEAPAGTKAMTETHPELLSHSGEKDIMQLDYIADCIQILSSLRSPASGVVSQSPPLNTDARVTCSEAAGYSCSEEASVHLSITGAETPHRSHPCMQSSCLLSDHASLWSSCSSSSRCATPFVGVAVSFPAPAPQPRPCQVATPPLHNDLLFTDIMEEEMRLDLIEGSYRFHLASHN